jgi:hypothetical protein
VERVNPGDWVSVQVLSGPIWMHEVLDA